MDQDEELNTAVESAPNLPVQPIQPADQPAVETITEPAIPPVEVPVAPLPEPAPTPAPAPEPVHSPQPEVPQPRPQPKPAEPAPVPQPKHQAPKPPQPVPPPEPKPEPAPPPILGPGPRIDEAKPTQPIPPDSNPLSQDSSPASDTEQESTYEQPPEPAVPSQHQPIDYSKIDLNRLTDSQLKAASALHAKKNQRTLSVQGVAKRQQVAIQNTAEVLAFVTANQPSTVNALTRGLNLNPSKTKHYLRLLMKQGKITATGWAQSRRYYKA